MQRETKCIKKTGADGFSLVELMIAVAIIGILAAIAIPLYNGYITSAKQASALAVLEQFPVLLEQYRAETGSFPPNGVYTYTETAGGVATDQISATPAAAGTAAALTDFSPRSGTSTIGVLFNYSLTIANSGTATESATYQATGVRAGAAAGVIGAFTYQ